MTWSVGVYPYFLIGAAAIATVIAIYTRHRFRASGVTPFTWLMLAVGQSSFFSVLATLTPDPAQTLLFTKISFIGITAIPPLWILFVLEYTQEEIWFPRQGKRLMWLMPLITLGLIFTNEQHGLVWRLPVKIVPYANGSLVNFTFGPWFWIYNIYSYALILGGIFILGAAVLQFTPLYRRQGLLLILGTLFPWVANVLYLVGLTDYIDLTPLVMTISGALFVVAFVRFHLFVIRPIARGNLMSNISEGILILDTNHHIADINQNALDMLALQGDLVGKSVSNIFRKWTTTLEEASPKESIHDEIKITDASGEEKYIDVKVTPLYYRQHFIGRVVLLRDITARKKSEIALRDSQALCHTLVENLAVAVFRKDVSGKYTFVNKAFCEMTGLPSEHILGKTDTDLFDSSLAWHYFQSDQCLVHQKQKIETEEEIKTGQGIMRLVHAVRTPIFNEQVEIIGIQGMLWDITEIKEKEAQLRQKADQLDTLNRSMRTLYASLDLQSVLESILSELQRVVPYDSCSVFELKGEYLEMVGGRGFPNLSELLGLRFHIADESTPSTVVMRTRIPYILEDAPTVYPGFRAEKHAPAQIHGWMGIPMLLGNSILGMLAVDKHDPNFYTPEHAELALAFASQAAIAIQNARLFTRVANSLKDERIRAERQSSLVHLSNLLASLNDENEIWQKAADGLYNPNLHYSNITMLAWDPTSGNKIVRGRGGRKATWTWEVLPAGKGVTERALLTGRIVYTADVSQEPDYVPGLGYGCEVDVPIWIGNEIAGVIAIESDIVDAFGPEDLEVFGAAANQIGLALGKARLMEEQKIKLEAIKSLEAQLREQAMRDALTGLYNRRYLNDSLARELSHVQRESIPLSIIMLDIDHFKKINDTYGHKMGDIVLINLSDTIKRHVRGGDIPCRYGGEEFVILLPGASTEIAVRRAEAFRAMFEKQVITSGKITIQATISLGVATFPIHGHTIEEVLNEADLALYAAKQAGRNQVKVASTPLP